MVKIGDIYYVKNGVISPIFNGIPGIVFNKTVDGYYQIRFQNAGELTHDYWNILEEDFPKYLERNK